MFKEYKLIHVNKVFVNTPSDYLEDLENETSLDLVFDINFYRRFKEMLKSTSLREYLSKEEEYKINIKKGNNITFSSYIENRANFLVKELKVYKERLISDIEYNLANGKYDVEEDMFTYFINNKKNGIMITLLEMYLSISYQLNKILFIKGDDLI